MTELIQYHFYANLITKNQFRMVPLEIEVESNLFRAGFSSVQLS